ncbi:hypothetical protein ACFCYB_23240 [Streptomyces sp. NPDC056309]|uniref:hypothetical protein n=1 Tax=Streptomyces sp. NPDC056309 TaxID=3345781 RepID=UPI0035E0AE5D
MTGGLGVLGSSPGGEELELVVVGVADIAIVVGDGSGDGTTWLEPVTDEQYVAALATVEG